MKLTGGEIVVEYLIKEGVPYVAGIPGHGCLALVDAFKKRGKIKMIQARHEQSAVHLADGYYRASGRPLAVFTSIGPGAINTATGLATSYVDSTAVLVLTGDTHTHMFGTGVLQEIERTHDANFSRVLEPVVKRYWQVTSVEQLPRAMRRAFNQMLSGRPGPALIDLPMDVQASSADISEISPVKYINCSGAIHNCSGAIHRTISSCADIHSIERAVILLQNAKRPVILVGGGVISAGACDELKKLAELTGAAVITTMMGKSAFSEDHPLYAWHAGSKGTTCGNYLATHADVLLAVGCRFADETCSSYKKGVSFSIPPTKLIHIDIDVSEIGKNYPVEVGIVGDAKSVLQQLLQALSKDKKIKSKKEYFAEIQRRKQEWFESLSPWRDSNRVPVTISRFLKEFRKCIDRDAVIVTSSGNSQAQVFQEFPFYYPKTFITTGGFSTMGFTLPAAIGVKLALPDKQVVGVVGDGDFQMTIEELATAVQYNIPVVIAVLNNSGWISIKDLQMAAYGKDRAFFTDFWGQPFGDCPHYGRSRRWGLSPLYSPDFVTIAKGFGCYAEKISRAEEVAPAFRRAFKSGKPAVVEVTVNREYPFSGGRVAGWWDVPVPTYLKERRAKYEREKKGEALL